MPTELSHEVQILATVYFIYLFINTSLNTVLLFVLSPNYRHYRLEAELQSEVNWRIRWDEINCGASRDNSSRKQPLLDRNGSCYSQNRVSHTFSLKLCLFNAAAATKDENYLHEMYLQ